MTLLGKIVFLRCADCGSAYLPGDPGCIDGKHRPVTPHYVYPADRPEWVRRALKNRLPVKDYSRS